MKTTKEKIEVMEWFENGGDIEERCLVTDDSTNWIRCEEEPSWDWCMNDYRKVSNWEPKYDIKTYVNQGTGLTTVDISTYCKDENAGIALGKLLERTTRIYTLAMELGGLRKWVEGKSNWYVFKDWNDEWACDWTDDIYDPCVVHMTRECALKIEEMLHDGEVML